MKEYIKINPADNVVVAIAPLRKGTTVTVDGSEITIVDDIPAGHKFALEPIAEGGECGEIRIPYRPCAPRCGQGCISRP